MFSDGSILIICQLVSHFLATNAIKIPHSPLPKSSEKALLGYRINTFNLLQSIALVLKEEGHATSTKSKMKLLFYMTRILRLFGILVWNVTTVSCYCSSQKKKELTEQMTFIVTQFTKMRVPGALTHLYNQNLKNFIYFLVVEEAGFSKREKKLQGYIPCSTVAL